MYLVRNCVVKKHSIPSLYRLYTTSIEKEILEPILEKHDLKDSVVVKKSSLDPKKKNKNKGSKVTLSQRLKSIQKDRNWLAMPNDLSYERVEPPQKVEVAKLAHGLDRVLFSPGVHYLKDPRTKQFNYTPYLENITQPVDFDFEALQPYITSSKDNTLVNLAKQLEQRYIGSTSSISAVLSQFYFLMSNFKPINTSCLSCTFEKESKKFTRGSRVPASIFLRWKDGVYAIDVDKSYDIEQSILSLMGKSLEKVLTVEPSEFEKYLKENSSELTEEEKNQPESYAYGKLGKFLLRSQLDCYDSRLPRGTFDLKTRAALPIRLDLQNYTDYLGYSLKHAQGLYESFEREYYDMMRSAFLKYSFQVRIGHMDGILVAYHNTRKMFGFQYISREEMDSRLFGSSKIGNQVFHYSLTMLETVLDEATKSYPNQTLRLSFYTKQNKEKTASKMNIFVEAVPENEGKQTEDEGDHNLEEFFQTNQLGTQKTIYEPYLNLQMYVLETQSFVNSNLVHGPLHFKNPSKDNWSLQMSLKKSEETDDIIRERFRAMRKKQHSINLPKENRSDKNSPLTVLRNISDQNLN